MAARPGIERLSNMSKDEILLQDEFQVFPNEKTPYRVELTRLGITYYPASSSKSEKTAKYIHFGDIIGCRCRKSLEEKHASSAYLTVFAYPLKKKMFSGKRTRRKNHVTFGRVSEDTFEKNRKVMETWRRVILHMVQKIPLLKEDVEKCPVPPKTRLLVLVNPYAGPGKAMQIYKKDVAPMLDEADIQVKVIQTEYAGHARTIVRDLKRSDYYGIVIVSGDGLIHEVINGLMDREDWQDAMKIPLACLPGGSGNALCCAINYSAGESVDTDIALHSTFLLIKHRVLPMDLVVVEQAASRIYSFLSLCWGLVSDIDYESEKYRAIGEARFFVQAVKRILGLRTYKGKLSFLPITDYSPRNSSAVGRSFGISSKNRRVSLHSLDEDPVHTADMERLRSVSMPANMVDGGSLEFPQTPNEDIMEELADCRDPSNSVSSDARNSVNMNGTGNADSTLGKVSSEKHIDMRNKRSSTERFQFTDSDSKGLNGTSENVQMTMRMVKRQGEGAPANLLPPLDEPVPYDWVTIEDNFVMVTAVYQTHLNSDVIFAPDARLSDGIIHINVVKEGISRNELFSLMTAIEKGDHLDHQSPYLDYIKVLAFRLEPESPNGNIMIDGERVECAPIQAQVLPGLANIMAIR